MILQATTYIYILFFQLTNSNNICTKLKDDKFCVDFSVLFPQTSFKNGKIYWAFAAVVVLFSSCLSSDLNIFVIEIHLHESYLIVRLSKRIWLTLFCYSMLLSVVIAFLSFSHSAYTFIQTFVIFLLLIMTIMIKQFISQNSNLRTKYRFEFQNHDEMVSSLESLLKLQFKCLINWNYSFDSHFC